MAIGHIIGGQCLDVATAGHVYAQSLPRSLTFDGTSTHLHVPVYDQNDNEFQIRHFVDGAYIDSVVFNPSFQLCDTQALYNDALTYIGAVIALWVAVWAGRALYDFFRVPHADTV